MQRGACLSALCMLAAAAGEGGNRYRKVRNEVCHRKESEGEADFSHDDHHDVDDEKREKRGGRRRGSESGKKNIVAGCGLQKDSVLILSSATRAEDQDEDRMRV